MIERTEMKKWHEYSYAIGNTTHDEDGNPMVEVTLYLKSNAASQDVAIALGDYLERGLIEEVSA